MDQETLARIGRPLMNCSRCNAPLAARAGKHPTVFVQGPLPVSSPSSSETSSPTSQDPDQVHRLDLCAECWPAERDRIQALSAESPQSVPRIVGFWMTRRTAPKPKPARTRPSRAALLAWWDACWAAEARASVRMARTLARPVDTEESHSESSPTPPPPSIPPEQRLRFIRTHLAALILMRHGALRWLATERPEDSLNAPEILSFRRTATQTPVKVPAFLPSNDEELDALANEVDAHMQAFLENPTTVLEMDPEPEATAIEPPPEIPLAS